MIKENFEILNELEILKTGKIDIEKIEEIDVNIVDLYTVYYLKKYITTELDYELEIILLALFASLNEGSLCLILDEKYLNRYLNKILDDKQIKNIRDSFLKNIISNKYDTLITKGNEYKPLVYKEQKNALYFRKFYKNEKDLLDMIKNFKQFQSDDLETNKIIRILKEVIYISGLEKDGVKIELDDYQILGIVISLINNCSIISGGPGTGKTSIVFTILRILFRMGIDSGDIILTTPTGRAAQRLKESLNENFKYLKNKNNEYDDKILSVESCTIHRLLKYNNYTHKFSYNIYSKLPYKVIIIDEVSMVNLLLMKQIFAALKNDAKIIMLGDKDQLPSIEPGQILSDFIFDYEKMYFTKNKIETLKKFKGIFKDERIIDNLNIYKNEEIEPPLFLDRIVLLQKSFRSIKDIQKIANEINIQNEEIVDKIKNIELNTPLGIEEFLNKKDKILKIKFNKAPLKFLKIISNFLDYYYFEKKINNKTYGQIINKIGRLDSEEVIRRILNNDNQIRTLFLFLNTFKILTLLKNGLYSTDGINNFALKYVKSKIDRFGRGNIFAGSVILITANDYENDLFNGDIGVVIKTKDNIYLALFERKGTIAYFSIDALKDYDSGFAITVHKSQGSEYNNILLVMPEKENNLLSKQILYTGVTRAKEFVFIYSKDEILKTAIRNRIERFS